MQLKISPAKRQPFCPGGRWVNSWDHGRPYGMVPDNFIIIIGNCLLPFGHSARTETSTDFLLMRSLEAHLNRFSVVWRNSLIKIKLKMISLRCATVCSGWSELTHSLSAAYMHQWTGSALVQIMACCLDGAKPLSKPMLTDCQLNPKKHISMKFYLKFEYLHPRKCISTCCLPKWCPFHPGRDELIVTRVIIIALPLISRSSALP